MSYIYVVQMDVPQALESEFNRIYDDEHVPTILEVPGVKSCRRYRLSRSTQANMPRYLAVYEVDDAAVIDSPAWTEASDRGEWKPKIRPHTTNRRHSVFAEIASIRGTGAGPGRSHLFFVQLDIGAADEAEFNRVYDSEHFPTLAKVPGVLAAARYRLDHSAVPGTERYLTLYEIEAPAVLESDAWRKAEAYGDWVGRIRPKLASRHHSIFERIA
jgi:hypothetical protein